MHVKRGLFWCHFYYLSVFRHSFFALNHIFILYISSYICMYESSYVTSWYCYCVYQEVLASTVLLFFLHRTSFLKSYIPAEICMVCITFSNNYKILVIMKLAINFFISILDFLLWSETISDFLMLSGTVFICIDLFNAISIGLRISYRRI